MPSKMALLIDAENMSYKAMPHILKQVRRHGKIVLQAVYGDWEQPNLQTWYELAKKNNFKVRHQTNDPNTKNSSDMKLIMDAMEVLYHIQVDTFCLVTNDTDYVPLCDKIHESQKYVIGVGYQHASEAFIRSCDQFIFIKNGEPSIQPTAITSVELSDEIPSNSPQPTPVKPINLQEVEKILSKAFDKVSQATNKWVTLSALGMALQEVQNGFKTKTYGYSNLTKLLQSLPHFVELKTEGKVIRFARLKITNTAKQPKRSNLQKLILKAFGEAKQDANRWVTLSALGSILNQIQSGFKTKTYGHSNLTKLLQSLPHFVELKTEGSVTSGRLKQ